MTSVNWELSSRSGEEMEVVVFKCTKILPSPWKFNKEKIFESTNAPRITLNEVSTYPEFSQATVTVKVMTVEEKVEVKSDQDVIVADATGTTKVTLWQDNNEQIRLGELLLSRKYFKKFLQRHQILNSFQI